MLSNEQRVGVFFLIGLALLVAAIELTIGVGWFRRHYTVYATFRNVQGLDVGADVRVAGIRVGRVATMDLEGDHVRVTLSIDGRYPIKQDAVAHLDFRALSGERFVEVDLGSPGAPPAPPEATIRGETPIGFGEAIQRLTTVADTMGQVATNLDTNASQLMVALSDVIDDNRDALGTLTTHLSSVTEKLDRGAGTLGKLINDPTIHQQATAALRDVRHSVQELGQVTHRLSAGQSTAGKLLTQDDGLYDRLRDTVDSLSVAARNAQEITDDLRDGQGTLGKALADDRLYDETVDTLHSAQRAAQTVEDLAPISLLGTIITSLF